MKRVFIFISLFLCVFLVSQVRGDFESGLVDDTAYDATTWNGVTGVAPSKNAVRDKIETLQASDAELTALAGLTFADVSIIQLTGAGAAAVLTCTANQLIGANAAGDAIECKSSINVSTLYLPSSDADPGTAAGNIKHDSTDTDASAGGIVEWYDGTNTRRVVDGAASAATNYTVIIPPPQFIPVAWMVDGSAAPGPLTTHGSLKYRDFDDAATKDVKFIWIAPADLIGTTVKVRAISLVTNATAPANGEGVSWGIAAASSGASDADDPSRGTEVFSTDADLDEDCNAQYDFCFFPFVEVTPTNLAAGEVVAFTVRRKHDETNDDYAQDIGLIGVEIKYKARINLVDTW